MFGILQHTSSELSRNLITGPDGNSELILFPANLHVSQSVVSCLQIQINWSLAFVLYLADKFINN